MKKFLLSLMILTEVSIYDINPKEIQIEFLCLKNQKTYDIIINREDLETKYELIEEKIIIFNEECEK